MPAPDFSRVFVLKSIQSIQRIKILLAFEQITVYTDFCEITDFIRSGIAQSKHYNLIK